MMVFSLSVYRQEHRRHSPGCIFLELKSQMESLDVLQLLKFEIKRQLCWIVNIQVWFIGVCLLFSK